MMFVAAAEAPAESDVKGVPQFWLQALGNHPLIADLMQEEDVAALEFLRDISVVYNETYTNFSLQFKFAENPFFSNEVRLLLLANFCSVTSFF